jgi:hypothetical protein
MTVCIDKVLMSLSPYIPLFQTLVWPAFLAILMWCFRRQCVSCVKAICRRIETGSSLKAGPIEIGEDLHKLDYASPQHDAPSAQHSGPDDWVDERNGIYKRNSGLFLTHILVRSEKPGQKYDIYIYLIRHKTVDFSDVQKAEFFFGHMWENEVFCEAPKDGRLGISTSAYSPFLCICRVHLKGGQVIHLHRYVDFEMERIMSVQR